VVGLGDDAGCFVGQPHRVELGDSVGERGASSWLDVCEDGGVVNDQARVSRRVRGDLGELVE